MRKTLFCLIIAALAVGAPAGATEPTGRALPGLAPFDVAMREVMDKWQIPGGSLAVARDGHVLLVHGYGMGDVERGRLVRPASRFRLGSLSKMLTAVAILQLAEDGRLGLDDKLLPILGPLGPRPAAIQDERVRDITVRQLLQHRAGFDRDISGDPLFPPRAVEAGRRQHARLPATCPTLLRDTLESPLDFAPGSRFAYSNVGYCMLGRVIERISGVSYATYVRTRILKPAHAGLRLGRTLKRRPNEVVYYDYPGAPLAAPQPGFGLRMPVHAPYGSYAIEAMDALGQWVGSPLDYLRFLLAIDGQRGRALLAAASFREMLAPPADAETPASYYGLGVVVRPVADAGANWWHFGVQPGVVSFAVRYADGTAWVAAFNRRPRDTNRFTLDVDRSLRAAARRVDAWPDGDLDPVRKR